MRFIYPSQWGEVGIEKVTPPQDVTGNITSTMMHIRGDSTFNEFLVVRIPEEFRPDGYTLAAIYFSGSSVDNMLLILIPDSQPSKID